MRIVRLAFAFPLLLGACNGWDTVETGDLGTLEFTPRDCGLGSCDLDDTLAVGGTLSVEVEMSDGSETPGPLTLLPDDPSVLSAAFVDESAWQSNWDLAALDEGWTDLVAVDGYGFTVDRIDVRVRHPDALALELAEGSAVREAPQPGFQETWRVPAGRQVAFHARPRLDGRELMGRIVYTVVIDRPLYDAVEDPSLLDFGQLHVTPPVGQYAFRFISPDGLVLDALLIAE